MSVVCGMSRQDSGDVSAEGKRIIMRGVDRGYICL